MINRAFDFLARRIDGPLMAAIALTVALGLTVVYSASGGGSFDRVLSQSRNLAFAPADDPRLAMAILVENGKHGGTTAGPIAREVFDYYLLGKRPNTQKPLEPGDDDEHD